MKSTIVIYRIKVTPINKQTHAFLQSLKIDATYSVYIFRYPISFYTRRSLNRTCTNTTITRRQDPKCQF